MSREQYLTNQQRQLDEWVAGRPWHNPLDPSGSAAEGGECCPDFSCCCPDALAPPEARVAFAEAPDDQRSEMLFRFLSGALSEANVGDKKIHIV